MLTNVEILDNTLAAWLTALAIALAANLAVGILKRTLLTRLRYSEHSRVAMLAIRAIARSTHQWLIAFATFYVGVQYLDLSKEADGVIGGIATLALFGQAGLWGVALLHLWVERYRQRALARDMGLTTSLAAVSFIGQLVLWSLILLLALDNIGVDVTALIAGMGIGGIAVALAVQNVLGDVLASLSIVIDKPFVIGDFIVMDDYMGTVEHVGLKTTHIRSLGGEQVIISNGDLLKARLRNYKRMRERRVEFRFGVRYQTTPEKLRKIPPAIKQVIDKQSHARFERTHLKEFGESALIFEVVYWVLDPDYARYMDIQQEINLGIMSALAQDDIELAQGRVLLLNNAGEESDVGTAAEPFPAARRSPREQAAPQHN